MNDLIPSFTFRGFTGLLFWIGASLGMLGQGLALVEMNGELPPNDSSKDYLYFDLGCNSNEWGGYFAPKRWQHALPDDQLAGERPALSELVQKESRLTIVFDTKREESETWAIEIPVGGYLTFRFLAAGNSPIGEASVSINGEAPMGKIRANGIYYSPFLKAGDLFSVHVPAGSTAYHWSQLQFHSNFSAVIVRPDEKTVEKRFKAIRQGRIQRVMFPDDEYGTWPVFDLDGDPLTEYDRQELVHSTERFDLKYEDGVVLEDGVYYLQRTFTIRERCRQGNWMKRSRKWVVLPLIPQEDLHD